MAREIPSGRPSVDEMAARVLANAPKPDACPRLVPWLAADAAHEACLARSMREWIGERDGRANRARVRHLQWFILAHHAYTADPDEVQSVGDCARRLAQWFPAGHDFHTNMKTLSYALRRLQVRIKLTIGEAVLLFENPGNGHRSARITPDCAAAVAVAAAVLKSLGRYPELPSALPKES